MKKKWNKMYGGRTRTYRLRWRIGITFQGDDAWINQRVFRKDDGFVAMAGLIGIFVESHDRDLMAVLESQKEPFLQDPTKSALENAARSLIAQELAKAEVSANVTDVKVEYVTTSFTRNLNATQQK